MTDKPVTMQDGVGRIKPGLCDTCSHVRVCLDAGPECSVCIYHDKGAVHAEDGVGRVEPPGKPPLVIEMVASRNLLRAARCRASDAERMRDLTLQENSRLKEELDKAREEAIRLRTAPEWQPIETAPKDGTRILAWYVRRSRWPGELIEEGVVTAYWTDHNGGGWVSYHLGQPTHWLPLPGAPRQKALEAR